MKNHWHFALYLKKTLLWMTILLLTSIIMLMLYVPVETLAYSARFIWPQHFNFQTASGTLLQPKFKKLKVTLNHHILSVEHLVLSLHLYSFLPKNITHVPSFEAQHIQYQHPSLGQYSVYHVAYRAHESKPAILEIQWTHNARSKWTSYIQKINDSQYHVDTQYQQQHLTMDAKTKGTYWQLKLPKQSFLSGHIRSVFKLKSLNHNKGYLHFSRLNLSGLNERLLSTIDGEINWTQNEHRQTLSITKLKGMYINQPLSGNGLIDHNNHLWSLDSQITLGNNHLKAALKENHHWSLALNINHLSNIIPSWHGTLVFNSQAPSFKTTIPFKLRIKHLLNENFQIQSAQITGHINEKHDVKVEMNIQQLHGVLQGFKSLQASLNTIANHYTINLHAVDSLAQQWRTKWTLIKKTNAWQGVIHTFDLITTKAKIDLKAPAVITYTSHKMLVIPPLCLKTNTHETLCLGYDHNAANQYRLHIDADHWSLNNILISKQYQLLGKINGTLTVNHQQSEPDIQGQLAVMDPALQSMHLNQPLVLPNLLWTGEGKRLVLSQPKMSTPTKLSINGWIDFNDPLSGQINLSSDLFSITDSHKKINLNFTPRFSIHLQENHIKIRSTVNILNSKITLKEAYQATQSLAPEIKIVQKKEDFWQRLARLFTLDAKIEIRLLNQVFIDIFNLSGQMKGALLIDFSDLNEIHAKGKVQLIEGAFDFNNYRYKIDKSYLSYDRQLISLPFASAVITRQINLYDTQAGQDHEFTVGVSIHGYLPDYQYQFFSSANALTEQQIISYMLLGYLPDALNNQEAQTKSTNNSTNNSSSINAQVLNFLQLTTPLKKALNIDEISFQSQQNTLYNNKDSTAVVLGKKINKDFYLRYFHNLYDNDYLLSLNYHLSPKVLLRTTLHTLGQSIGLVYTNEH